LPKRDAVEIERMATIVAITEAAPNVTLVIDAVGTIKWASQSVEALVHETPAQVTGRNVTEFVDEADLDLVVGTMAYLLDTPGTFRPMDFRFRRADGTGGVLEAVSTNRMDDPRIDGLVVQLHEVTERRIADEVLEIIAAGGSFDETLRLLARLVEAQLGDTRAIVGVDPHGSRFAIAASTHHIVDELAEAALGDHDDPPWAEAIRTAELVVHADLSGLHPDLRADAEAQGFEACWVFPVVRPGGIGPLGCLIAWRTRAGRPSPGEEVALDRIGRLLTLAVERRDTQDLLVHAARHDTLTGLPNRSQFFRHLARELHLDGHLVAVLYLDLDRFKPINDEYGHRAGDHVLTQIARRIEGVLRPRDLTARLGGDEFGVLCSHLRDEAEAVAIAERLIAAVERPLELPLDTIRSPELAALAGAPAIDISDGAEMVLVSVGVSIGIAFGHQSGVDDERLVEMADAAMYQAKASGRGTWVRSGGSGVPADPVPAAAPVGGPPVGGDEPI
jgi:diguanylate cyclase (GGDEF)-like protein/PAS domain S-box-containing protein